MSRPAQRKPRRPAAGIRAVDEDGLRREGWTLVRPMPTDPALIVPGAAGPPADGCSSNRDLILHKLVCRATEDPLAQQVFRRGVRTTANDRLADPAAALQSIQLIQGRSVEIHEVSLRVSRMVAGIRGPGLVGSGSRAGFRE